MNACGCPICKQWPVVEARAKREPGRVAQALLAKFVGDAYTSGGKDTVKRLATCPSIAAAVKTRERIRLAERESIEEAKAERAESRKGARMG